LEQPLSLDYKQYPVLFVDDEEANRIVFRATFGREFTVHTADSADSALSILAESPVAILITDQRMPGTSGVELAEVVCREYPLVVRIIVTAYADIQTVVDAINRGKVSRFINKPWKSEEVRGYLRSDIEHFYLNQRVDELQSMVVQAERLATLGLAASSIAHDIGNPLTCLVNNLNDIDADLREVSDDLDEADPMQGRLAEVIDRLGDCQVSVEEITLILKAVRGSIQDRPRREAVHLTAVVESAARLVQTEIQRRAMLRVNCANDVWVEGEAPALAQMILNLLVNAAHAVTSGRPADNTIALDVKAVDDQAVIIVRDTGCGFEQALQEKIFTPLFTTRASSGGTGLGLSIVRRAVDRHMGTIDVHSSPGQGTTFTVKLPLLVN